MESRLPLRKAKTKKDKQLKKLEKLAPRNSSYLNKDRFINYDMSTKELISKSQQKVSSSFLKKSSQQKFEFMPYLEKINLQD